MYIRKSTPDDLPEILPIYANARAFMTEVNPPQVHITHNIRTQIEHNHHLYS